jgi:hypothetical protein
MTRKIVQSIADFPEGVTVPLGCVLDDELGKVVAYGAGGTFSTKGMLQVAFDLHTFEAYLPGDDESITVRAVDLEAALQWLRSHHMGAYEVYVQPPSVFLGTFEG